MEYVIDFGECLAVTVSHSIDLLAVLFIPRANLKQFYYSCTIRYKVIPLNEAIEFLFERDLAMGF